MRHHHLTTTPGNAHQEPPSKLVRLFYSTSSIRQEILAESVLRYPVAEYDPDQPDGYIPGPCT